MCLGEQDSRGDVHRQDARGESFFVYLVGYDETSKAFCIYLPSLRKVVVRREVKFEEEWAFRKSRELVHGEQ